MKVTNTTAYPKPFLRALAFWVLKQLDFNTVGVGTVAFRKRATVTETQCVSRDWQPRGGRGSITNIAVWVAKPPPGLDPMSAEAIYAIIIEMGAELRPNRVPEGDLGKYRQAIGKAFMDSASDLLARWGSAVPEALSPEAVKRRKAERVLQNAQRQLSEWSTARKTAETKVKVWTRRVVAAQKALDKLEDPCETPPA